MDEKTLETLRFLKKAGAVFEVGAVTTFHCARRSKGGDEFMITVEVYDAGPDSSARYIVTAKRKDGKAATSGNSHERLDAAIAMVHWGELDV